MKFPRASGVLLHITSLPGRFGIGDTGSEAYKFVDFLAASGQSYWQILPIVPTGYGDSPYSSSSAFAGNTLLISPDRLVEDELLPVEFLDSAPQLSSERVDYGPVYGWKRAMLAEAFLTFQTDGKLNSEFGTFCDKNSWWLDDYALLCAKKESSGHKAWFEWDEPLKRRDNAALDEAHKKFNEHINAEKFNQFIFFRQWLALKNYANEKGIKIIGDVPIFVALDSVDVWCNQDKFKLNDDGSPIVVSGVPPDSFSATGQRWGSPIYDWQAMLRDNFGWWTARLAFAFETVDIVRLDHFIGFARNWEIPGEDETAENGQWADVPGHQFFEIIQQRLGELALIAEDLGAMTLEVENLRDTFGIPGMRILQYAFGGDASSRDLPHNYNQNSVVYTGTHDNDTTAGWYRSAAKNVKHHCRTYLKANGREISWDMTRAAFSSVADTAIVPAQDLLGLGNEARMNLPCGRGPNWQWRLRDAQLNEDITQRLRDLTETFGRIIQGGK